MAAAAVQQILERMVPELEDLQERGIFTQAEVRSIVDRRREHEYAMHRRAPDEVDFVRAIEYELNLEALRRRRKVKLGMRRSTLADHAGLRRVHFIFDRATRRLRADARWWTQWADFCIRTRSTRAADRVFGRALQLHPRDEALWILAASWHFDRMSNFATARSLMTRAVRVNRFSRALWVAFFRLECVYVLRMKGRRFALGLDIGASTAPVATAHLDAALGGVNDAVDDEEVDYDDEAGGDAQLPSHEVGSTSADGEDATVLTAQLPTVPSGDEHETDGGSGGAWDERAAARAAFFAGSVPRIIYDQAVALLPDDAEFRLAFLRVVDELRDVVASSTGASTAGASESAQKQGQSAASAGPPAPAAFPALATHILASIAGAFPADAHTWRVLALRPLDGLQEAVDRVARAAQLQLGRGRGEKTASDNVTAVHDPTALRDDDLFVVDGPTSRGAASAAAAPDAVTASDVDGRRGKSGAVKGSSTSTAAVGAAATAVQRSGSSNATTPYHAISELDAWLRALASGAIDAAVAAAAVSPAGTELQHRLQHVANLHDVTRTDGSQSSSAALFLPPWPNAVPSSGGRHPRQLWVARATAPSSAAATAAGAGGRKRGRVPATGASGETASPQVAVTIEESLDWVTLTNDVEATAVALWAAEATAAVSDVAAAAAAAAPAAHTLAAVAEAFLVLWNLPLPPTIQEAARRVALLEAIEKLCSAALDRLPTADASGAMTRGQNIAPLVGSSAGDAAVASPARGDLLRLRVQALLRRGLVSEALVAASAAGPVGSDTDSTSIVLRVALAHALQPAARALTVRSPVPQAQPKAAPSRAAPPAAALLGWTTSEEWSGIAKPSPRVATATLLDSYLQTYRAAATAHVRLWSARLAIEWVAADSPSVAQATAIMTRAVDARPASDALALLALQHIEGVRLVVGAMPRPLSSDMQRAAVSALRAASPPTAPPAVHLAAIDAVRSVLSIASNGASGLQAAVDAARRMFEVALTVHGSAAPELWARYVAFERAELTTAAHGSAPVGRPRCDAGSRIYARAVRALSGQAAHTEAFLALLSRP